MDCEKYLELMSAALDGECTAEERRDLDSHLAVCPECAELFRILSANAEAARELDCEMPADLKDRIMHSLPDQEVPAKKGKVIHWKRWIPVAAAACLVLVVSLIPRIGVGGNTTGDAAPNAFAPAASTAMEAEASSVYCSDNASTGEASPAEEPDRSDGTAYGTIDPSASAPSAEPANPAEPAPSEEPMSPTEPEHYGFTNQRSIRIYGFNRPEPGAQIIGSVESLETYLDAFQGEGQELADDLLTLKGHYSFYDLLGFFENHRLLCIMVEAPSGDDRFQLATQGLYRNKVVVEQIADGVTHDMGYWLIVAEVDAMFEDGDTLDVSINKAYDQYYPFDDIWVARKPSSHTSSSITVIQTMNELVEYLETYAYLTNSTTGELIRDPEIESLISIYGTPITEHSFESSPLLVFTMIAPVYSPKYEVLTVNADAVTVRQDYAQTGDLCGSSWLILVEAYGDFNPENPPKLVVIDGFP